MAYEGLGARLGEVRERIGAACVRAGRPETAVSIVAVTKTHPASAVEAAVAAGLTRVGENRVQELESKIERIGRDAVEWHLIGTLQRNKAKKAVSLADLIHSVDSRRLAEKLSAESESIGRRVPVLVQVNVSGEESKSGFPRATVIDEIGRLAELPGLRVEGLMTMAPFTGEARTLRETFSGARMLLEEASRQIGGFTGRHLSMGMSNDYEIAVEEGSTLVRLGTVFFGERER